MLSRLLELSESETVMADRDADALPAWVSGAVQATAEAGLKDLSDVSAPLTRRDAALLLHEVWQIARAAGKQSPLLGQGISGYLPETRLMGRNRSCVFRIQAYTIPIVT